MRTCEENVGQTMKWGNVWGCDNGCDVWSVSIQHTTLASLRSSCAETKLFFFSFLLAEEELVGSFDSLWLGSSRDVAGRPS